MFVWKDKNKWKIGRVGPFFKEKIHTGVWTEPKFVFLNTFDFKGGGGGWKNLFMIRSTIASHDLKLRLWFWKVYYKKSLGNYLGRCQNISYYTSANIWVLKIEIPPMPLYEEDQKNNWVRLTSRTV